MASPWWWWEKALDGWLGRRAGQVAAAITLVALSLGVIHPALTEWLFRSFGDWGTHELMSRLAPILRSLEHLNYQRPIHSGAK